MDIQVNLQALNGASLGILRINSNSRLSELKSAIIDHLSLPAWHMHLLFGEVQLKDEDTHNELVGETPSPASVDLTAVFDSQRILLEVRLEKELYRIWQAKAREEIQRRELRNFCDQYSTSQYLIEDEIEKLDRYILEESLSLGEERACWKRLQELRRRQARQKRKSAAEYRDKERRLHRIVFVPDRTEEILSELEDMKPPGNNSTWLWLNRSTGLPLDLFTMPDVCYGPAPRFHHYTFGPQGPSLYSRWCRCEDEFCEHYCAALDADAEHEAEVARRVADDDPEEVFQFKLSRALRKFEGWGRADC